MVGCFLTPTTESPYTFPPMLKREIEQVVGEYVLDVRDFRTEDKDYLLRQVYEMTDRRFALAEHFLVSKPWELFVMVEMGVDRMYHGFWKLMDPEHRKHEPGNRFEHAIFDYHRHVDELMGRLLAHTDEDTAVFVVSDHGGKRMDGGIRINEWLRREGLLATLSPDTAVPLREAGIDWSQTTAWGRAGTTRASSSTSRAESPRARSRRPTTSGFATTWHGGSRRSPTRTESRSAPACTPRRDLPGGERGRARPDRPLRRPLLALGRDRRRRGGYPQLRERHRARRREPRAGRLFVLAAPGRPVRAKARTCWMAPTVLELMGLDVPASMRGRSLLA